MRAKLGSDDGKNRYKMRKQTVKPVFGTIKSAIGFTRFQLRGLANAATEWSLVTLAYNCKRIARMQAVWKGYRSPSQQPQPIGRKPNPTGCYDLKRAFATDLRKG